MNKLWSGLCASTLALSMLAAPLPAAAAPTYVPQTAPASLNVENVQYDGERRLRRQERREMRRERREERREDRREARRDFERRGDYYYYNGHRGYRERRSGYRYYNGYYFPAGAFIAGAIIGSVINSQPKVVYRSGGSHVDWCYNRYRSYRAYDNTFQPYGGPRQQCYSPYR